MVYGVWQPVLPLFLSRFWGFHENRVACESVICKSTDWYRVDYTVVQVGTKEYRVVRRSKGWYIEVQNGTEE